VKGAVVIARHQINLVAQVFKIDVDRRRRQQKDLRARPGLNHRVHQTLIARRNVGAVGTLAATGVVAEVVAFINDNQAKLPPVEVR